METIKKEQRSTNDQITSTMGTMEGARRATGIVPMVAPPDMWSARLLIPRFLKKSRGANLQPNTSFAYWLRPMPAASRDKWAPCCAVKACIPQI